MIKEIKTEKFEGLAVLIPDDADKFSIKKTRKGKPDQLHYFVPYTLDVVSNEKLIVLPSEGYEILGKSTELTEEKSKLICMPISHGYYCSAKDSFHILLYKSGCYILDSKNKPIYRSWLVLKKI